MTDNKKTTFEDLSPWLKVAIIWALVHGGLSALMLLFYAIIGITLID